MNDHELAAHLAEKAGELLVELRTKFIERYNDPWTLKDLGDMTAHKYLAEALAEFRPEDSVLSEEGVQMDFSRKQRVWIIDPLDGTREFGEYPRDDWAVHIALVVEGKLAVGAVSIPEREQVFSTANPPTVPPFPVSQTSASAGSSDAGSAANPTSDKIKIAVSRTRPGRAASALYEALDVELLPMGSAGVKTMAVIEGKADIYAHSGGQKEWDSAAPVAVARSAGLWTSHLDGSELIYNRPNPFVENLIVCRAELADVCLKIMKLAGF